MLIKPKSHSTNNSRAIAKRIVQRLQKNGFLAFFVGGCVRDYLMKLQPKDYDIATSAKPNEVMKLFSETIDIGANFGVIQVMEGEQSFAVATFRSDGNYDDGRHPNEVEYALDPKLDVQRRDFTINGLYYDPLTQNLLDFVGAQQDIQSRIIRTIGSAEKRFREDRLRLIRAIRFSSQFGYTLEKKTQSAILKEAPNIIEVSPERIRDELVRILTEGYSELAINALNENRLLVHILPDVAALRGIEQPPQFHPEGDVWTHTLKMLKLMDQTISSRGIIKSSGKPVSNSNVVKNTVQKTELKKIEISPYPSMTLAMATLLHDIGKPNTYEKKDRIRFNGHAKLGAEMAFGICQQLRFSKKQQKLITELIRDHLKFKDLAQMRPSTLRRFLGQEGFSEHLELHRLDCLGSHGNLDNWKLANHSLSNLQPEEIHPPALLTGKDLIEMGYLPGPVFKKILNSLKDAQFENELKTSQQAKQWVLNQFDLSQP
ncbi:MAG: CCA tRNA nucleotidyltransferase [Acidobacteriia bacterium]|nr:CCA tRNA nucleotidyltransferase [Terriglobia bacterium]